MGLQINTEIGTIDGITSKAYVRIINYTISKYGYASFTLETFMQKEDSIQTDIYLPSRNSTQCSKIGSELRVPLMSDFQKVVQVERLVLREITYTNSNGEVVTETREVMEMVDETITVSLANIGQLENLSIFTFAYSKLKEKLIETFGITEIVDV
jgi:hypothetical protein